MLNRLLTLGLFLLGIVSPAFAQRDPRGGNPGRGGEHRPPRQEPPRQQPPRQEPPRQQPPRQEPPRQQPPRREPPRQQPPNRRPPVIVPPQAGRPGQPGRGRVMPVPPRPIDRGGLLDPRRHGDGRAHTQPNRRWDGKPITHRPWTNPHGRHIPPSRDHVTIINNTTIINNINHVHRGWNTRDHNHSWYYWNGHRLAHRYDTFGYHWWGFYIGDSYFWTRYNNGRHWWYDPYYQRWVYLHDGRWWWQDPFAPTVVYLIIDNRYYRYQDNAGTIIVRPDPATPVVAPPAEPAAPAPAPDEDTMYSLDGTRSIQILGAAKEAYLYDLTAADPNGAAAGGKWLATGGKSAKFVYDDKHEADGTTLQVIRQIELDFDDPKLAAVADLNGERKIVISGDERSADLYNLEDEEAAPSYLASGVGEIKLVNAETANEAGKIERALKLVIVSAKDASGIDTLLLFDRDGAPYDAAAPRPEEAPAERMRKSPAFNELTSRQLGW